MTFHISVEPPLTRVSTVSLNGCCINQFFLVTSHHSRLNHDFAANPVYQETLKRKIHGEILRLKKSAVERVHGEQGASEQV